MATAFPEHIPTAQVSEGSDGTISASIEETNRIRVALGLKPLKVGAASAAGGKAGDGPERAIVIDAKEEAAKAKAAKEQPNEAEMKERIKKAKIQRSLLASASLGEDDGNDDLASWLVTAKSKMGERLKSAPAAAAAKTAKSATYDSSQMEGIVIGHDAAAFEEGKEVILTLRDRGVLDEEGDDDNALENTALMEQAVRERNERRKKGIKKYRGYDETKGSILPQYDDMEADEELQTGRTVLGKGGVAAAPAAEQTKQEVIAQRLSAAAMAAGVGAYLEDVAKTVPSSVLAPEEVVQFRSAPGEGERKKRKKRKTRTTTSDAVGDEDEGGEGDTGAGAAAGSQADGGADHGSRAAASASRSSNIKAAQLANVGKYQAAVARATESARLATTRVDISAALADEDAELQASVVRARMLALAQQKAAGGEAGGAEAVAAKLAARQQQQQQQQQSSESKRSVTFDSAADFTRNIGAAAAAAAAVAAAPAVVIKREPSSTPAAAAAASSASAMDDAEPEALEEGEASDTEGKAPALVHEPEPQAGSGMAAALERLRRSGAMSRGTNTSGRVKDEIVDVGGDGPQVMYLDPETGRRQSQREAFRQQCYSFHNKKPSLNSQERKLMRAADAIMQEYSGHAELAARRQMAQQEAGGDAFRVSGSHGAVATKTQLDAAVESEAAKAKRAAESAAAAAAARGRAMGGAAGGPVQGLAADRTEKIVIGFGGLGGKRKAEPTDDEPPSKRAKHEA